MQKKIFSVLFLLAALVASGSALAHEFIIKPAKTTAKAGEQVSLQAQAAHVFMVSEEAEEVGTVKVVLLQDGKETPIILAEDKALLALTGTFTLAKDGPAMLAGHRLPLIWSETTDGVLEGDRKTLEAQGKKVIDVGKYEKFAKTLLNASPANDLYKKNLGHEIEILLLTNPAEIKAGGEIKVQTLLHGKPAKMSLGVTHDGFSKEEDTYLSTVETDAQGMATAKLTKPGLWMLRAAQKEKLTGADADTHILRATYVFSVE